MSNIKILSFSTGSSRKTYPWYWLAQQNPKEKENIKKSMKKEEHEDKEKKRKKEINEKPQKRKEEEKREKQGELWEKNIKDI